MPVILGSGIPLVQPGGTTKLVLSDQKVLSKSGIVMLSYSVAGAKASGTQISYIKQATTKRVAAGTRPTVARRKRPNTKRRMK